MSYSKKMVEALQAENLVQAKLDFADALKYDDPDTLADLGETLLSLGFLEEAQQIFQHLLEQFPDAEGLNIPLAEIAIENNEIDEAFIYLEKITPTSDSYIQSLLVSADLYQVLDFPEVSEAKLKEAATLAPEEPLIQFALAELYFATGNFVEAIPNYQALLVSGADVIATASIDERLGSSFSMLGDFEAAIPYLEKAVAKEQTDDRLFQLAFTYLQLHDNQKAIALFQQLQALNPHYQSLYLYLAEALQEEEQLEAAREVAATGLKENPYQVELYQFAAENAYRLHDSAKAEALLLQALELGEKTDETRLTLSNLYLTDERFEDSITILEGMEESSHPYAEWNLAKAYNELEEFEVAKVHFEQAYQDLAHEPEFLKEYALFLREEGQLAQARDLLIHYLQHEPGDLDMQAVLADIEES
ncbi:tetratricopeptide repeat protein [Enterococcus faecalis]